MLRNILKQTISQALAKAGYEIRRSTVSNVAIPDPPPWVNEIIARVRPYTMTSPDRIAALCSSIEYIVRCKVPGDIVECGVWKGGSMMAAALALMRLGDDQRELHLFDTFEGMSAPTDNDRAALSGELAAEMMAGTDKTESIWAYSSLKEVQTNLMNLGYPADRIKFIPGRVEDTLPEHAPNEIALLRLDTDWYESTRHELVHLYPRLRRGGILIIDDYGYWEGARKAVDEYISDNDLPILLNRIDNTGRLAVKI